MQSTPRRLTLVDLITLVAAAGLSVAAQLQIEPDTNWLGMPSIWRGLVVQEGAVIGTTGMVAELAFLLFPSFAIIALALLSLRLRQPRPHRWRRLWFQPGSLACLFVAGTSTIALLSHLAAMLAREEVIGPPPWSFARYIWPIGEAGTSIAAAWTTLLLTGHWRPERSWIDRAGRALGTIVLIGASCYMILIHVG